MSCLACHLDDLREASTRRTVPAQAFPVPADRAERNGAGLAVTRVTGGTNPACVARKYSVLTRGLAG
jgi:hypothetical protein